MVELKYSALLLLVISTYSEAKQNTQVSIDNQLSNCIKIEQTEIVYQDEVPMLNASYKQLQTTSECGCKSKILTYSSLLEMDGYNSDLMKAQFTFEDKKQLSIPVATSKKMIGDYDVLIKFTCSISN